MKWTDSEPLFSVILTKLFQQSVLPFFLCSGSGSGYVSVQFASLEGLGWAELSNDCNDDIGTGTVNVRGSGMLDGATVRYQCKCFKKRGLSQHGESDIWRLGEGQTNICRRSSNEQKCAHLEKAHSERAAVIGLDNLIFGGRENGEEDSGLTTTDSNKPRLFFYGVNRYLGLVFFELLHDRANR